MLLRIPFVFIPGIILWVFGCLLMLTLGLFVISLGADPSTNRNSEPFWPSLKGTCAAITKFYSDTWSYLKSCVQGDNP